MESTPAVLVVYDTRTNKPYILSAAAADVWHACHGSGNVQDIAEYLNPTTRTNEWLFSYALSRLSDLLYVSSGLEWRASRGGHF